MIRSSYGGYGRHMMEVNGGYVTDGDLCDGGYVMVVMWS